MNVWPMDRSDEGSELPPAVASVLLGWTTAEGPDTRRMTRRAGKERPTPMGASSDQRKFQRIPETVAITVRKIVYPMTDESAVPAVGKNISAGGICFTVSRPFEPGDLLSLQINLTGWRRHKQSYAAVIDDELALAPLTAVAKVAWCQAGTAGERYEIGVLFENVDKDDFRALEKYLSWGTPS